MATVHETHETYLELKARLMADGYRAGAPPTLRTKTIIADVRLCEALTCPVCARKGLDYNAYHKRYGDGPGYYYKVAAECLDCGAGEEI